MSEDVKDRREEATEGIRSASDLIRDPSKLMIMAVVRRSGADYLLIRRFTGLSKGNLSNHLAKLEKSGMVTIGKHFEGKKPVTTVNLTEAGKETIEAYWSMMEKANAASREYDPERSVNGHEDLPTGGQVFSPLTDTGIPHWRPSDLPTTR